MSSCMYIADDMYGVNEGYSRIRNGEVVYHQLPYLFGARGGAPDDDGYGKHRVSFDMLRP